MSRPRKAGPVTKEFFTPVDVAIRWGVSISTVRRQINRGRLIAHKLGGQTRIARDDLVAYERRHRQTRFDPSAATDEHH